MQQKAILGLSFVILLTQCTMSDTTPMGEPRAKEIPFEMTEHGDTRAVSYTHLTLPTIE